MVALIFLAVRLVVALFKSKSRLEAENAALRQQLIVLRRKVRGRVPLTSGDRLFFVQLYRWFPSICKVITIASQASGTRKTLSRKDLHVGVIGAVLFLNPGAKRSEILPRRLDSRGGASVVRRNAATNRTEDLHVKVCE